jgi:CheY-like chemotaxis protein
MVFEGDPAEREAFLQAFISEGYNVALYDNPDGIKEIIERELPDLVFIDTGFPGLDWETLCREIYDNEHTFEVAVVPVCKEADIETIRRAKKAGAMDLLIKPIQPYELLIKTANIFLFKERCHMKSNLVASHVGFSVEHYVGQPLTAVLGAVKTLRSLRERGITPSNDQLHEMIDIIIDGSDELSVMIKKFGKLKLYRVTERFSNKKIIDISHTDEEEDDEGVRLF